MNFKYILGLACSALAAKAMGIHEECLEDITLEKCNKCDVFMNTLVNVEKTSIYSYSGFSCFVNDNGEINDIILRSEGYVEDLERLAYTDDLERLTYIDFDLLTQDLLDFATSKKNLQYFELKECNLDKNLDWSEMKNLKNLKTLKIWGIDENFKKIPDSFYSLKNLEELEIYNTDITSISDSIANLKNLKILNLNSNNIKKIPKAICQLKNLEEIEFYGTKIENPPKTVEEFCNGKKSSDIPISTNGKCGEKYGKCPKNRCCSKYGYCGTSSKYCGKGCQSEFGRCE